MLKEARIVMPIIGDGADVDHDKLRNDLLNAFGGYTYTRGAGAWRNSFGQSIIDSVGVYDIALEADRDASWDQLFQIAMAAGRELKQEAVYIRYPDGTVEITKVNDRNELGGLNRPTEDNGGVKTPLGAKRLPQVGEVWRNSVDQLIAVIGPAGNARLDGGYFCSILSRGDSGSNYAGHTYYVDLDGKVLPDKSSHPRDLKTYVARFDS